MTCKEAIYSESIYDFVTDFLIEQPWEPLVCYQRIDDLYSVLYIDRAAVPNLDATFFEYQSVPNIYGIMQEEVQGPSPENLVGDTPSFDATSLIASGILQVQRSPLSLEGTGVVVCFIDTGIDYTNPVFLDDSGNSRILAIWDQTIEDGIPPEGYQYGAEYTREQINLAIQEENPYGSVPSRDTNGHGTAMASVAVGSALTRAQAQAGRYPEGFTGAAPDADIVVVKLKEAKQYLKELYLVPSEVPVYQENDIMLAVDYCDSFARLFARPVVICLGLGTNMGDHSGSAPLSSYLSRVATRRNRAVVICGGNEGNARHHYHGNLRNQSTNVTGTTGAGVYQDVEVRVEEGNRGFFLELWGNMPDIYNVTLRSPGGETIPPIRLGIRQSVTYGFVYERSRVTIDSALVEPASGEELMLFRIRDPTPGIWTFRISAIREIYNGEFNMWLPITQFLNTPVYFLRSTPDMTLTEPAMAINTISVSTYDAANNSFYINSGRGFSRSGAIRPDMAAPGVNVSTVLGSRTGSSYAAAITAGAVAQFLEWAVVEKNQMYAESREIQSFFVRGATKEMDLLYPNREWGYGRLNVEGTFEALIGV